MSEPKGATGGLQFVAAPASGWCDPETGVCHVDTVEEAVSAEANDEGVVVSDAPHATSKR